MPKLLTQIGAMTIHPGEAGVSSVSVWFNESRAQHERVTFAPTDLFDYRLFSARVLEITGHPFRCPAVEDASSEWRAEMLWREVVYSKLEEATVEPQGRFHWKALSA